MKKPSMIIGKKQIIMSIIAIVLPYAYARCGGIHKLRHST